ncbi:MBL fold metallo-hydrolase [Spirochaetia bacterium]|nr:MBL fold metallo-hydrolase [Spirochaetia bacterium]
MLSMRLWGVRGTIPCPGPDTVVYGGNTACVEIRADDRLVIVDMGTGIRALGDWLIVNEVKKARPLDTDIFISHTHTDHIMGLPVFTPIFIPTTKLHIWGPVSSEDETLESILGNQLSYRYWPIRLSELSAKIEYTQLRETTIDLGGGLSVSTKYMNHPILCLGYRFEYQGKSIVTAFDCEPFYNVFPADKNDPKYDEAAAMEGALVAREENERLVRFYEGADILVHDSQYTDQEYPAKLGWGHSTFTQALDFGLKASVKKLVCFHHDPNHTDEQLAKLEQQYRCLPAELGAKRPDAVPGATPMELSMAKEGVIVEA